MKLAEMKERNKAVLFGVVIILGMLGLAVLGNMITGGPVERSRIKGVRIDIIGEGWEIDCSMDSTVNNTAYLLLKECAHLRGFEIEASVWQPYNAVFVDSINGLENRDGKYWQYYVNGEYGEISSDRMELKDGDLVEWIWEMPRI